MEPLLLPLRPNAAAIGLHLDSAGCIPSCESFWDDARRSFADYFLFPEANNVTPQLTPAVIPVSDFRDYTDWLQTVGKNQDGNRRRLATKAARMGYYVKPFPWKLFIGDIVDINHSKTVRSGGEMRGGYLRSIEEMGGLPSKQYAVEWPRCMQHWALEFGVFAREESRTQGAVTVDEKLYGYIAARRYGDIAIYSMILGHGDYLKDGVMVLLHHEVVRWFHDNSSSYAQGLRYLMYGAHDSGGRGLMQWKHWGGFKALDIDALREEPGVVHDGVATPIF